MSGVSDSTELTEVYVVNKVEEEDGLHVFVNDVDAERFAAACKAADEPYEFTAEPCGDAERVIAAQRGDALESIGWPEAGSDVREGFSPREVLKRIQDSNATRRDRVEQLLESWAAEDEEAR